MALLQLANNALGGGVGINGANCSPCAINTDPTCAFNGTHNVPNGTVPCNSVNPNDTYFPREFVEQMAGKLQPVRKIFQGRRGILQMLVDFVTAFDTDGTQQVVPLLKKLPRTEMSFQKTFVQRGERYYKQQQFTVAANVVVASNTIQLAINGTPSLGGTYETFGAGVIEVGDTIRILRTDPTFIPTPSNPECCADEIIKTVIAVNTVNNTVTLENTAGGGAFAVTYSQGDIVEYMRTGRNDCEAVTKKHGETPTMSRVSYIQHLDNVVEFDKQELNTPYSAFGQAKDFVLNRLFHMNIHRVQQFGRILYLGRNRNMSASGSATKGETQGLLTAIRDGDARNPGLNLLSDLSAVVTEDDKVRIILDEIMKIQDSGWIVDNEPVTILMNRIAANSMLGMQRAWSNFLGITFNMNNNTQKEHDYPIISTPAGSIKYEYCEFLSELYKNEGYMVLFPKSAMAMTTRPNHMVVAQGSGLGVERYELAASFEDVSANDATECRKYRTMLEFTTVFMGIDSGAFRIIKGIRPCR